MKKVTHRLSKAIAALTRRVATKGAGLAIEFGRYQAKVPERLCK